MGWLVRSPEAVLTDLHLAFAASWDGHIVEPNVPLTIKSNCFHHLFGDWMGLSPELKIEIIFFKQRRVIKYERKMDSSRRYLLFTSSSPTKSNFSTGSFLLFWSNIEIAGVPTLLYKRGILVQRFQCGTRCQPRIYIARRTELK